jgi:hypothetical protein
MAPGSGLDRKRRLCAVHVTSLDWTQDSVCDPEGWDSAVHDVVIRYGLHTLQMKGR